MTTENSKSGLKRTYSLVRQVKGSRMIAVKVVGIAVIGATNDIEDGLKEASSNRRHVAADAFLR